MKESEILLISYVFYPDEAAVPNLLTKLCINLIRKYNLKIRVWCSQPTYTTRQKQPKNLTYNGISINYLKSTRYHKKNFAGRILNYITFSQSLTFKLLFTKGKFPVISHTTPPFLAIIIALLCRLKRRKFYYLVMDLFPEGLIRLGIVSRKNIFIILWNRLHRIAINFSESIIVIGRDMEKWFKENYLYPEKIHYIPLWQDEKLIKPVDFKSNPFVIKYKLKDNFIVQYSGNMGLWNDLEIIGQLINEDLEDVKFIIIGDGIRRRELIRTIDSVQLGKVMFLPFLPEDEYKFSACACHASIVTLKEGLEGIAVPSKLIGIMAAGIPVIAVAPEMSEVAFIVNEENCGYVVKPGEINNLISAIVELRNNPGLRYEMGMNGRKAFEKKYTTNIIAEKYYRVLKGSLNDLS